MTSWAALAIVLGVGFTWSLASNQTTQTKPAHELLSANTVVYFTQDGSVGHEGAWKKTAAHAALYDSGLMDVFEQLVDFAKGQMPPGADTTEFEAAFKHVSEHGLSGSISLTDVGLPTATVVLHDAAPMEKRLVAFLNSTIGAEAGFTLEPKTVLGREVHAGEIPETPGIELSVMSEAGHLVMTVGLNASAQTVTVAKGDAPNLGSNSAWKKYNLSTAGSEATTTAWLDFGRIVAAYERFPIPDTNSTIGDALKAVGLHNLKLLALQSGYKGRAIWSEMNVDVEGERTGLLALASDKTFTLADLPPLPHANGGFAASRFDPAAMWETLVGVARNVDNLGPPNQRGQVDQWLDQMEGMLGFNPKTELLDPIGDLGVVFTDPDQGLMGLGSGFAMSVDDAPKLRKTADRIVGMISEAAEGDFGVRRVKKYGRDMLVLRFANRAEAGAIMIDDKWMVISLMPQTCEAFALRADGKLPAWEPDEEQAAAFAELPKEMTSVAIGEPRTTWSTLLKVAPIGLSMVEAMAKEQRLIPEDVTLPVSTADIPPAELVVQPLFPNVTVGVVDAAGMHTTSRQSLPSVPFLGGGGEGSSVATTGVLVALLLPAIQQAREAARRTQSKNNLKNLALAMHNYHAVYNHFPAGTHPNADLKPDARLSWMFDVLPYLEQAALHQRFKPNLAWDAANNRNFSAVKVPVFTHPGMPVSPEAHTHYVGLAGVGADGPELAVDHERAGVFANNRKTRFRDIRDGASNTLMLSEASAKFGSWARGGNATYRPITKKPYINGPDGIGGPSIGGVNMGLADGSVRFISEAIDPEVFEALNTIAGREVIDGF
jgi:hypothetical protein